MDFAEAENAARAARRRTPAPSSRMADVDQPRDPVTEWEELVTAQFQGLRKFAKSRGCFLNPADLPPRAFGKSGQEHETYHAANALRFWKFTFPGQSGFGPFGYQTPAGYLHRLRLSNLIFGDDVAFEGILQRREGLSIVTSQNQDERHKVPSSSLPSAPSAPVERIFLQIISCPCGSRQAPIYGCHPPVRHHYSRPQISSLLPGPSSCCN